MRRDALCERRVASNHQRDRAGSRRDAVRREYSAWLKYARQRADGDRRVGNDTYMGAGEAGPDIGCYAKAEAENEKGTSVRCASYPLYVAPVINASITMLGHRGRCTRLGRISQRERIDGAGKRMACAEANE